MKWTKFQSNCQQKSRWDGFRSGPNHDVQWCRSEVLITDQIKLYINHKLTRKCGVFMGVQYSSHLWLSALKKSPKSSSWSISQPSGSLGEPHMVGCSVLGRCWFFFVLNPSSSRCLPKQDTFHSWIIWGFHGFIVIYSWLADELWWITLRIPPV